MTKLLKSKSGLATIVVITGVLMLIAYLSAFSYANRGWGYYGYNGYNRGPSFFYWHSVDVYPRTPSMKTGGVNSPGYSSKGMRGGK